MTPGKQKFTVNLPRTYTQHWGNIEETTMHHIVQEILIALPFKSITVILKCIHVRASMIRINNILFGTLCDFETPS